MPRKLLSGYFRLIVLAILFLSLFCSAVAVAAVCPSGCSCLLPADAKAKGYDPCSGQLSVCGYDRYQNTLYCYKTGLAVTLRTLQPLSVVTKATQPGTCSAGCSCMLEADAKTRYGDYTRCSADVCGYELRAPTNALAATQVPKYCVKQAEITPVCPEGCTCLSDANAKARFGTFTRCQADPCGYDMSTLTTAAYQIPKYCVKQGSTPVCPEGCVCISDEDAKLKGLTDRCDNSQTPCGYRIAAATTTNAAQRIPLSCYKIPSTTPVCPQGCSCLQEADALLKFGPNNYTRCQADICGYDPPATTANGIPKYCFRPTVTPTSSGCPAGCTCTTNATAGEKGLAFCGGKLTSCGYDENKQPRYCFQEFPSRTCFYDYQKNVCSGTCTQGYTCGLLASEKDTTGMVTYGVCGCTGQPATICAFDTQKNACTGTCQNGAACSVVGKNVDETTGTVSAVCGCPQQGTCSYNYEKDACFGTCTVTGENCQLNTIYRDPTSGKVTYVECHCKGGDVSRTCVCDANTGSCTGTCSDGQACTTVDTVTDSAGKTVCSGCACRDTCVLTADNECSGTCANLQACTRIVTKDDSGQEKVSCGCGGISPSGGTPVGVTTRQPGFLEAIGSFFNRLFGGK